MIFPLLFIWGCIGNYYYYNIYNKNFKLSRMSVSATHAVTVILSYVIGIPGNILMHVSISYYLIDTVYELMNSLEQNKKIKIYDLGIVLHHVVSIVALTYFTYLKTEYYLYKAFYLAEISNLPMYLVYHLQKINYANNYVLKPLIAVEALGFIILRLIMGGSIFYEMLFENEIAGIIYILSIIMLIISVVWSQKLIVQLFI